MILRYDKSTSKGNNFVEAMKAVLLGSVVGSVVCAVFLVLFAFLFVAVKSVPQSIVQIVAIICASLGAFVAGYISIRIYKSKGLIYGAASGLLLFIILTIIAFIVSRDKFTYITAIRLLVMLFSGALGGVLGVNQKRRK